MAQLLVDILERFSRRVSTEAAYLASMVLRYRLSVADVSADKIISKGIIAQPRNEVRRAATSLLREIERSAGKNISAFDKKTVEKYLRELARVVQQRSASDLRYEEKQGQELLRSLRSE
jgi:hypothetical protein